MNSSNNFLSPGTNESRPDWSAAFSYFQTLSVARAPLQHPAIEAVLGSLRATHVNGGAQFGRWELPDHPILGYFAARHALDVAFFGGLLRSSTVRADLPMLKIPERFESPPSFHLTSSLSLEGDLANDLHIGGAYTTHTVPASVAKRLAADFCDALIGNRFDEVDVYTSHHAWAPWFYDVAWDMSWFGLDRRDRTCWLLCKTDTD